MKKYISGILSVIMIISSLSVILFPGSAAGTDEGVASMARALEQFDSDRPDLALGKDTSSSNPADGGAGAVNGELDSDEPEDIWVSESILDGEQYLLVDLGAPTSVIEAVIYWGEQAASQYSIQGSANGVSGWETLAEKTKPSPGQTVIKFTAAALYRYFRVLVTETLTQFDTVTIHGFELYAFENPDIALATFGTTATARSNETAGLSPDKAINGVMTNEDRWSGPSPSTSNPQWFQIDLKAEKRISNIVIYWEGAESAAYRIQLSNDANNWTNAAASPTVHTATSASTNNGNTSARTSIVLPEIGYARYIRVTITAGPATWTSTTSIIEFEVYSYKVKFPPRASNLCLWHDGRFQVSISSSGNGNTTDVPSNVVSGNWTTKWTSRTVYSSRNTGASRTENLTVNFGVARSIRKMVLHWDPGAAAKRIRITGGINTSSLPYTVFAVQDITIDSSGRQVIDFGKHWNLRRIQITIDEGDGQQNGVSLIELEAFSEPGFINVLPPKSPQQILNEAVPTLSADGKSIVFPNVELPGYDVKLFGSDTLPIIDLDGAVFQPLVTKDVALILQVVSKTDPDEVYTASRNAYITVPGEKAANTGNAEPVVIPSLREWSGASGNFSINESSRLVVDPACVTKLMRTAEITAEDFKDITGRNIPIVTSASPAAGDIYLTIGDDYSIMRLGKEGYYLTVGDYVTIEASESVGVFYGTRTALQILKADPDHNKIPKGQARDYPKYEQRGFHIDCGRKYIPMSFLNDYVKLMSWYKMNTLNVHLNDNGFVQYFSNDWNRTYEAFRLESSTYPGLTAKDGSYTKDEFRNFQKKALDYGMDIIPEIDTPAHSLSFVRNVPGIPIYNQDHIDVRQPATLPMMQALFEEYLEGPDPVFINKVNIGTDEFPSSQTIINGDTGNNHFRKYIDGLLSTVRDYGKSPYFWGSLSNNPGTYKVDPTGTTVLAWYNGYYDPELAIKEGFDIVSINDGDTYMVPAAGYYSDYLNYSSRYSSWEPVKVGGITFPYGHPNVKGGMFAVWNDIVHNGISVNDIHVRTFPAVQVFSEKTWSGTRGDVSFSQFAAKADVISEAPNANISKQLSGVANNEVLSLNFKDGLKNGFAYNVGLSSSNVEFINDMELSRTARFSGGKSYIETSITDLGFGRDLASGSGRGWTMTMDIMPDADNPNDAILFESDKGLVKLKQGVTGLLGFNSELYPNMHENNSHKFDYAVPAGQWTTITLTSDNTAASLYVNGVLSQRLNRTGIPNLTSATSLRYVETLVLPLNFIGGRENSFKGLVRNIKVYNKVCSATEISALAADSRLNKIKLLAILDYADALDDDDSVSWSKLAVMEEYVSARDVYNNNSATSQMIEKAYDDLKAAILAPIRIAKDSGKAKAFFRIAGEVNDAVSYNVILAIYDGNGKMKDLTSLPGTVSEGAIKREYLEADLPVGYTAKAFIWEAFTFVPLTMAKELRG